MRNDQDHNVKIYHSTKHASQPLSHKFIEYFWSWSNNNSKTKDAYLYTFLLVTQLNFNLTWRMGAGGGQIQNTPIHLKGPRLTVPFTVQIVRSAEKT